MPPAKHVALIVEDHRDTARVLVDMVRSIGHDARVVETLEEVRAEIARGGFCYVLLDLEIPVEPGAPPMIGAGETALELLRESDHRRNDDGRHWLQILIVTAYSTEPDFVSRMYDADANGFIAKPFGDRPELVLDRIRNCLKRARRDKHELCAPAKGAPERVTLALGARLAKRDEVFVNGVRCELQHGRFVLLVKLIDDHLRAKGSWSSRSVLGIVRSPEAPSRLRDALAPGVPEGFEIIQSDRAGSHRLNPLIEVAPIDWGVLRTYPEEAIRKIAMRR
jgi:DNA-binding response OmpR family regulator